VCLTDKQFCKAARQSQGTFPNIQVKVQAKLFCLTAVAQVAVGWELIRLNLG
jgi:hypothetical protein